MIRTRNDSRAEPKLPGTFSTLSPFRYPGGKSWLRRKVLDWISIGDRPELFLEPFAGGASVSLAVAELNAADHVLIVERDPEVATVWRVVLSSDWHKLVRAVRHFKVSRKSVKNVLEERGSDPIEIAFRCLLKNRVSRSGILAGGAGILRSGEDGKGLNSRWYPETIAKRIELIHGLSPKITFEEGDGLSSIRRLASSKRTAIYVDPPYTSATEDPGQRLYRFHELDHSDLLSTLSKVKGRCLISYRASSQIRILANRFGLRVSRVRMRTAHHRTRYELLLTKR
jgi:DNA adenine methylase